MQRKIKIRAWHSVEKEWVTPSRIEVNLDGEVFDIYNDENVIIQESTGLFDSEGKEIFEGDIVKYSSLGLTDPLIGEVRYTPCEFVVTENWSGVRLCLGFGMNLKIIGNAFQNPELLK